MAPQVAHKVFAFPLIILASQKRGNNFPMRCRHLEHLELADTNAAGDKAILEFVRIFGNFLATSTTAKLINRANLVPVAGNEYSAVYHFTGY